jgi:V8-like Glu-specific endopeptidase
VIAPGVVLTAGHCSCGNPAGYRLYFGKEMQNPGTPQIGVRSVERHPDYRCALVNQPQPGVDYAIIRFDLTNPEVANEYEEAVAMPVARARELVATFRVVGYGFTHRQGEWGNRQRANVPVASWDCTDRFAEGRGCQPFSEFILSDLGDAGARGTGKLKDSCGGDSGGPAFAVVQEDDGCGGRRSVSYLVGITSRGIKLKSSDGFNKKCGGGGVYEVVARKSIASWLQGLRVPFVVPEMSPLSTLNQ